MRDGQRVTLTVQPSSAEPFNYWNNSGDEVFKMPKLAPPMVLKRDAFPPSFESLIGGAGGQLGISVDELSATALGVFRHERGRACHHGQGQLEREPRGREGWRCHHLNQWWNRRRVLPTCGAARNASKAATSSR